MTDFDPDAERVTTGVELLASDLRGAIDWGTCEICGVKIQTMTFYGEGVCGDLHKKERDGKRRESVGDPANIAGTPGTSQAGAD